MSKMRKLIIILFSIMLIIVGCSSEANLNSNGSEDNLVYVSFYPLYFLADEIGGDHIDLRMVVPNGVESHEYEPSMQQLKDIEKAQLFIYNGAGFESWADKVVGNIIEEDRTINASESVHLIMEDNNPDPHIWLSPQNMIKIGETIKDRLVLMDAANKDEYERNFNELASRLMELDNKYFEELKDKSKDSIIVSHAAFTYLADRYGFEQIPVAGISPEQEPSSKTIADLIEIVKNDNHEYILLETLASPKTVQVIAEETNLQVLTLNPIEGLTEEDITNGEDYITIMEKNLENLKKALVMK
ncbi:MAG: zinc ABC transporter solute-binding protein [Tissierellia bacterium]|nr:zinc ABC transporter solute-binding protein [Tissierellia bacterium]